MRTGLGSLVYVSVFLLVCGDSFSLHDALLSDCRRLITFVRSSIMMCDV